MEGIKSSQAIGTLPWRERTVRARLTAHLNQEQSSNRNSSLAREDSPGALDRSFLSGAFLESHTLRSLLDEAGRSERRVFLVLHPGVQRLDTMQRFGLPKLCVHLYGHRDLSGGHSEPAGTTKSAKAPVSLETIRSSRPLLAVSMGSGNLPGADQECGRGWGAEGVHLDCFWVWTIDTWAECRAGAECREILSALSTGQMTPGDIVTNTHGVVVGWSDSTKRVGGVKQIWDCP